MKHTEDKYSISEYERSCYKINNSDGFSLLSTSPFLGQEEAKDISEGLIKCWNSHPVLVDALKQIEQMSDPGSHEQAVIEMKSIASKALKEV